jgi:Uncharacterized protein conserved in bacteria, putative lipoprotein
MRLALVMLLAALSGPAAASPSFDCAAATAPDELAICGDDSLAQLDDAMAMAEAQVRALRGASLRPLMGMLLEARQACGADRWCIAEAQRYAIEVLGSLGAKGLGRPGQFFLHTGMGPTIRAWHRAHGECLGATLPDMAGAACHLRDQVLAPMLAAMDLCRGRADAPSPLAGLWLPCAYGEMVE